VSGTGISPFNFFRFYAFSGAAASPYGTLCVCGDCFNVYGNAGAFDEP
jgi:hypothetical protein